MKATNRVVITGMGALTSNGNDVESFFVKCLNGVAGLKECTLFDASQLSTSYYGQIDRPYPYLTSSPGDKERIRYIIEDILEELTEDSHLYRDDFLRLGERAMLSFSSTLNANFRTVCHLKAKERDEYNPDWLLHLHALTPFIKDILGIKGHSYSVATACSSSTTAAGIAYDLIAMDKADIVVTGGAEPLDRIAAIGFNALKALSKSICRPFDMARDGINLGEGGAFLIFESLEHAQRRNAKIYAEILGYGINNEAYHFTSPDPEGEGARLSMEAALRSGDISPDDVDYFNAHGTGTVLNDEMEIKAMCDLMKNTRKDKAVMVSSSKSMIGHCMSAAGALELVITAITINKGVCTPTSGLKDPMYRNGILNLLTQKEIYPVRYALSNSFAFAGNTSSILVGTYDG